MLVDGAEVSDGARERAREADARRAARVKQDLDPVEAAPHPLGTVEAHPRPREEIELAALARCRVDLVGAAIEDQRALVDAHRGLRRLHVCEGMGVLVIGGVGDDLPLHQRRKVAHRLLCDAHCATGEREREHRHRRAFVRPSFVQVHSRARAHDQPGEGEETMRGDLEVLDSHRARARAGQAIDEPVVLALHDGGRHCEVAFVDDRAALVVHHCAEQEPIGDFVARRERPEARQREAAIGATRRFAARPDHRGDDGVRIASVDVVLGLAGEVRQQPRVRVDDSGDPGGRAATLGEGRDRVEVGAHPEPVAAVAPGLDRLE